jgi:hypothetical protein
MKNFEAEQILIALKGLSESSAELSVLTAYTIIQDRVMLENRLKPYLEMKDKIIMRYSKDGTVTEKTPGFNDCLKEISAIGNEEIEAPAFKKIKPIELKAAKLPVNLVGALFPIFEERENNHGN